MPDSLGIVRVEHHDVELFLAHLLERARRIV